LTEEDLKIIGQVLRTPPEDADLTASLWSLGGTQIVDGQGVRRKVDRSRGRCRLKIERAIMASVFDVPLFKEKIEAWANGPVVRALYNAHKGQFTVNKIAGGDPKVLTTKQRETIDSVLKFYADRNSQWLSDLTHQEAPWRIARNGTPVGEPSNAVISHAAMAEYYGSL
jgi:uncharacterized phage-associated protein